MFVIGVVGDTLEATTAAIERLAGCSMRHALPRQAALQPHGWLASRCVCYLDPTSNTLWMGVAAGAVPHAADAGSPLSREEARELEGEATRALLILFATCHAVLWVTQQAQHASTALLKHLRLLQQLKAALLPALPALLGVDAASATSAVPGLCVPLLLVLVQPPPVAASWPPNSQQQQQQQLSSGQQQVSGSNSAPLSAAQAALHPLANLIKQCRVLHPDDGSARALCTLPTIGPLLLPLPEQLPSGSQQHLVAEALVELRLSPSTSTGQHQPQQTAAAAATAAAKPAPTTTAAAVVAAALAPHQAAVAAITAAASTPEKGGSSKGSGSRSKSSSQGEDEAVQSWRQAVAMLAAVLEAAAASNSPASTATSSQKRQPKSAEMSEEAETAESGTKMSDVAVPAEAAAAAAWQSACSKAVWDFSLASSKRAAAVASDAYRRNTRQLMPAVEHAAALQATLRLYRSLARGPAATAAADALQQQLNAYWRDGHMQCDAVSFLGNPCCLPAHDSQQQPHASSISSGSGGSPSTAPRLLLASGSGSRQHSIPEPFTVVELQRAASAVASESGTAAARAQFYVGRLAGAQDADGSISLADVAGDMAGGQQAFRGMPGTAAGRGSLPASAAATSAGQRGLAEMAADAAAATVAEASGRGLLSGGGLSSDGEEEQEENIDTAQAAANVSGGGSGGASEEEATAAQAAATDAAALASVGAPAAGCWLELHVLGPRSMYKSPALAAALLMDGQPGWLRAGGVMLASLPVQVAVPLKAGQAAARGSGSQAATSSTTASAEEGSKEEFPSLEEVKQQQQEKQQQAQQRRQQRASPKKHQKGGDVTVAAKAGESAAASAEGKTAAEVQLPAVLSWPGLQQPSAVAAGPATARAPLFVAPNKGGKAQHLRPAKQRSGKLQASATAAAASATPAATAGPAAAAAAAVAAGAAGTAQVAVLLGVEYESVEGQRLLLTPALLSAALQSSLDRVSVRQQQPQQQQPPVLQPRTAAVAAAAAALAATALPTTAPAATAAAFLLQHDLPLWLQLPGEHLTRMAGIGGGAERRISGSTVSGASGVGSSASAGPSPASAATSDRSAAVWLQLRRLLVGTPEVAVPLEAAPKLQVEVPRAMLAPALAPPNTAHLPGTSGAAGTAGSGTATATGTATTVSGGNSEGTVQLEYSLASPLPLPPASFCVLCLPWLLTSPMDLPAGEAQHTAGRTSSSSAGSSPSKAPTALIRQSGPLRAVLTGHSMVRPAGLKLEASS